MIIQALHQLSSRLPDRRILTWEFFFNRFDALYLEAQIALEKYGDIAFPRGRWFGGMVSVALSVTSCSWMERSVSY